MTAGRTALRGTWSVQTSIRNTDWKFNLKKKHCYQLPDSRNVRSPTFLIVSKKRKPTLTDRLPQCIPTYTTSRFKIGDLFLIRRNSIRRGITEIVASVSFQFYFWKLGVTWKLFGRKWNFSKAPKKLCCTTIFSVQFSTRTLEGCIIVLRVAFWGVHQPVKPNSVVLWSGAY